MAEATERTAPDWVPTTNALAGIEEPRQGVLIDAAYVRFSGSSSGTLDNPPELEEERTYIVRATCTAVNRTVRKDKEERVTTVMEIQWLYEQGRAPVSGDSNQHPLFDETGQPYEATDNTSETPADETELDDDTEDVDDSDNVVRPNFSDGTES